MTRLLVLWMIGLMFYSMGALHAQNPVAYYPFSGNTKDVSAFANTASIAGARLSTDRFGWPNNAFQFDGQRASLTAPNAAQLNSGTTTISFWVRVDALPAQGEVFLLSHGGWQERWKISLPGHGKPVFTTNYANGISDMDSGDGNNLTVGKWTHVAMVHDGNFNKIYMDGRKVAEKQVVGALNTTVHPFGMGYDPIDKVLYFNGALDEVMLFDEALSDAAIESLFEEQNRAPEVPSGLVADYGFETVLDNSPQANHARAVDLKPVTDHHGKGGSAMQFNGASSTFTASNAPYLNSDFVTVSFWIKVNALPEQGEYFLVSHGGWQERFKISLPGHGKPVWTTNATSGISDMDSGDGNALQPGRWTHVAMVHDGSQDKIYMNGILVASKNVTGTMNSTVHPLGVGYNPIDGGNFLNGDIDELQIFNFAVSDEDIAALYAAQSTSVLQNETLVANYAFNGDPKDGTPFGNDAISTGAHPSMDRHGYASNAMHFDGNATLTSANSEAYQSEHTSIAFWAKADELPASGEVFLLSHGGWQERWKISLPGHGKPVFTTNYTNGISDMDSGDGNTLVPGQWKHWVMVHDGSTNKIYMDGNLVAEKAVVGALNRTRHPLGIGYNPIDNDNFFKGALDEVRLYNYALSGAEVAALYNSQSDAPVFATDLVANYTFSGNSNDQTEFHNHARTNGVSLGRDRFNRANQAYAFQGMGSEISASNSPQLNSGLTTVSFWVNLNELPGTGEVFLLSHGGWQERWKISLPSHGKPVWTTNGSSGISDMDSGDGNVLVPGEWTHVVMVHDGALNLIYFNGNKVASKMVTGNLNSTQYDLGIGFNPIDNGNWINGSMDEVMIFNRALNEEEILALYIEQSKEPVADDTEVPSIPLELDASVRFTSVSLTWQPSSDNVGVTGYNVYLDGQKRLTTQSTAATFDNLPQLTNIEFAVSAVDAAGNESGANALLVTVGEEESPDTTPPTMPGNLRAETGSNAVLLIWDPSVDDRGVAGYVVLVDGLIFDTLPGNSTSVLITGLEPQELYTFEVYAFDAAGNDSEVAELTISTDPELDTGEPGLVAHYPFEDNANDATPYNNHGSLGGAPIFEAVTDRPNAHGKAIVFDGVRDSVVVPNAVQLISDFATVSFWIRPDRRNLGDAEAYIMSFGHWDQRWKVSLPQHLKVVWTTNVRNQQFPNFISDMDSGDGNELALGFWWYVTMVHDGQFNIIYVDGEEVNRRPVNGTLNSTARSMGIGFNPVEGGQFFPGAIDEIKIYNKALTAQEILSLYNSGSTSTQEWIGENLNSVIHNVYPNPAIEQVNIQHSFKNNQPLEIRVFDLQGRQVDRVRFEQSMIPQDNIQLDVNHYVPGSYLMNFIYGGKNVGATKMIKQ